MNKSKYLLLFFFAPLFSAIAFSQEAMSDMYVEKDNFYFVKTGPLNRQGILVKNHLDSLIDFTNSYSGYIHVPTFKRFNNSKIGFDINDGALFSLTSYFVIDQYNCRFVKVPIDDIDLLNSPETEKYVNQVGLLAFNSKHILAINHRPIRSHTNYYRPREDSLSSIFFDLAYVDSTNLKLMIYNNKTLTLEHWDYSGEVTARRNFKKPKRKASWNLTSKYRLDAPILNKFSCVVVKNKTYLITHEGLIYLANDKLTEIGKFPNSLERGYFVINKEKGELSYIAKESFNSVSQTIRMLLKNAVKIKL